MSGVLFPCSRGHPEIEEKKILWIIICCQFFLENLWGIYIGIFFKQITIGRKIFFTVNDFDAKLLTSW